DQVAIGDGLIERAANSRVGQHVGGVDRRNDLTPHGRVRRDYGQVCKAEILHGPRRRADVVRIARADQHDSSISHFPEKGWRRGRTGGRGDKETRRQGKKCLLVSLSPLSPYLPPLTSWPAKQESGYDLFR